MLSARELNNKLWAYCLKDDADLSAWLSALEPNKIQDSKACTVAYIQHPSRAEYLFLYRNKKEGDINLGKYIGVGGKVEEGETYADCNQREIQEEVGFVVEEAECVGYVLFANTLNWHEAQWMAVYRVSSYSDAQGRPSTDLPTCSEGELEWLSMERFFELPHWVGDECFLRPTLAGQRFGLWVLLYDEGKLKLRRQFDLPEEFYER